MPKEPTQKSGKWLPFFSDTPTFPDFPNYLIAFNPTKIEDLPFQRVLPLGPRSDRIRLSESAKLP